MEITQELIDSLVINEPALMKRIAGQLAVDTAQVSAVAALLEEGCTVPFIARYRKERTGSLDEVQVRDVEHLFSSGKNLESRRIEITRGIFAQGKLDGALYENIQKAATLTELEDIYAPYKRKKKTRGMAALEKGLGPLADAMKELEEAPLREKAAELVRAASAAVDAANNDGAPAAPAVETVEEALQGAMDIIAEQTAQDAENRADIKSFYLKDGRILVKASGAAGKGDEEAKKTSVYQMYWDFTEPLSRVKPHRVLAINRGEREGVLDVTIDVDSDTAVCLLWKKYVFYNDYHKTAVEDGQRRLLSPAVIREIRGDQGDTADDHGISVFSQNLKNLLMQQPIRGTRVLGIDPGIRTGTKCAFLDDTGKYLGSTVIYNHKALEAKRALLEGIKQYDVQLVAVGNGTGTRDVQEIVSSVIAENSLEVLYTVVDEDGASVYSAGDIAREEFPELDLTIRGAISIGRRLQDPLAELVKIDPKAIGVGLYQHDLNQKKLSDTLDEVVSSVVNNVGVNINTASVSLLKYVSGINGSLARKIVQYRDGRGKIASRAELVSVPGMGPKSFEQCAGFLKIPESGEPLDNTWVHPENYAIAREIREMVRTTTGNLPEAELRPLREKYGAGDATIADIVEELKKPNRDPRDGYPRPIMQKGVVTFEDLSEGMAITGKIKNVVDFGAFVDLGIKETALVHISELSDHYVKDPLELVKAGDVLEFHIISLDRDRRRIGLSRKTKKTETVSAPQTGSGTGNFPGPEKAASPAAGRGARFPAHGGGKKERLPAAGKSASAPFRSGTDGGSDDGTMYNPFAAAFKKMEERKEKKK
ncbi:MAG: RNA-binding transcriptional accessory protein [Spirochaetaceae bacterium]|nr:RNA-binding transcriptional accessory protein [Spirochaetaceae bacterium]